MKITRRQLKRIIREEKLVVLKRLRRRRKLNETIQRKLKERYGDYEDEDDDDAGNNEARMADHDPIQIQVPAYEEAFPEELEDSPEGKAFDYGFANKIAEVLEGSEPDYQDSHYDYDDQNEDYVLAKKIWDVAEEAGLDNSALASNIKAAYEEANEAGYNY